MRVNSKRWWRALVVGCLGVLPVAAQTARDIPAVSLSFFGGTTQSRDLWRVPNQQVLAPPEIGDAPGFKRYDTVDLERRLASDVTFGITATKFVGQNVGLTGELSHSGFKTTDRCTVVESETQDAQNQIACTNVSRTWRESSTTDLLVGGVFRPMPHAGIQLYFLVKAGVAYQTDKLSSLVTTTKVFGDEDLTLVIYPVAKGNKVHFTRTAGLGVSGNVVPGLQLHAEWRQSWHTLGVITGASSQDGVAPPRTQSAIRQTSLLIGVDLVLSSIRGRRY